MNSQFIIVCLFLLIGVLVIIKNIRARTYHDFFWFCDFAPFLLALGFMLNNYQFIRAIVNIGLLTQLSTSIFLITGFLSGLDIIGSKTALDRGKLYVIIELLIHLLPINLAYLLIFNIQPALASIMYSLGLLVIMYVLTRTFTPEKYNINLVYNSDLEYEKGNFKIGLPYHKYLWIFYVLMVSLITFLIQYLLYVHIGI